MYLEEYFRMIRVSQYSPSLRYCYLKIVRYLVELFSRVTWSLTDAYLSNLRLYFLEWCPILSVLSTLQIIQVLFYLHCLLGGVCWYQVTLLHYNSFEFLEIPFQLSVYGHLCELSHIEDGKMFDPLAWY